MIKISKIYEHLDAYVRKNKEKEESPIVGLETWNVINGENFSFMFSDAFNKNDTVELNLSTWRFNSQNQINFIGTFENLGWKVNEVILDITGWNITNGNAYCDIFSGFAPHAETVQINNDLAGVFGLEKIRRIIEYPHTL